ncbi:MAG: response regulator [Deltaproteobacteria bacterium]|nr:MAG: response regulator [Deltaproteobacteria bacterium]
MTILSRPIEILLVGGDAEILRRISETLSAGRRGVRTRTATDEIEAIEILGGSPGETPRPDLVVLAPATPGEEEGILTAIKGDERLRRVPVIVLIHHDAPSAILAAYHRGANACIVRPAERAEFEDMVGKLRDFWLQTVSFPS